MENRTNRIGISPLRNGEPTNFPFSPASGPIKNSTAIRPYNESCDSCRMKALFLLGRNFIQLGVSGALVFSKTRLDHMYRAPSNDKGAEEVDAIMKNQLQVASTAKVVSGMNALMASLVRPWSSVSVPATIRFAVKPAWALRSQPSYPQRGACPRPCIQWRPWAGSPPWQCRKRCCRRFR